MTQFEVLFQDSIEHSKNHVYTDKILIKLAILAGMVYDPETDKEIIENDLLALSSQIYNLQLLDEWQSLLIHNKGNIRIGLQERYSKFLSDDSSETQILLLNEVRANYSKILGWTLRKAKEYKIYND